MTAMIHAVRLIRTSLFLLVTVAALSLVSGLIYLNQVGFPGGYGEWISEELDRNGLHLSFETLRFEPTRGLVATKVSLFQDEARTTTLLEADEMVIDLDKTKAMRGTFKLHGLEITNGMARIPSKDPAKSLRAEGINGKLEITDNGHALLREASARIEGIEIEVSASLKLVEQRETAPSEKPGSQTSDLILGFLEELELWTLPPESPPRISFQVEGDLNQPDRIQTTFQVEARNLSRRDYEIKALEFSGDLHGQVITLDRLRIEDESGVLEGQIDWSLDQRDGRVDLRSTLRPRDFLRQCFGPDLLPDLHLQDSPRLTLKGSYTVSEKGKLAVRATGKVAFGQCRYRETAYDRFASEFSWRDNNLFLRDLELASKDKLLRGNLIIRDENIEFDLNSTLPIEAFRPVIKPGTGLDLALQDLSFSPKSIVHVDLKGNLNQRDPRIWSASGEARLENLRYKKNSIHRLATKFQLDRNQAAFSDLVALPDDQDESVRRRHGGQPSGEIRADRILFQSSSDSVTITNLRGKVWPSPIVRIFAPKTAAHLAANYRFHQPPHLTLNGRFAGRAEDKDLTSFSVGVRTTGRTDYPFLGYHLPLNDLKADVMVQGERITVKNLTASTLEGTIEGAVSCDVPSERKTAYRGDLTWSGISFRELSRVYQFEKEERGTLGGKITFVGVEGSARGFNAEGAIMIARGNLVSIPILGPLSPLMAGILRDKRMGYERAKNASGRFTVREGVLETKDFTAISTSITLTGEGWIDLHTDKMDMVVRVNARGLLGLISLPLQPLKGIFQFRGTGTFDKPNWRSAPFSRPPRGENDPIFRKQNPTTPSR